MPARRNPATRRAFTLVELLVSIAIVAVLAALAFLVGRKALQSANGARDMATMRQLFNTIPLYAADNNGILPGPTNSGVKSVYGPQSTGRLSYYIAGYLGYNDPQRDDFLEAMAYTWQRNEASRNAPCAYLRENVPLATGTGTIKPFGHPLRKGADRVPKSMTAVFSQINPIRAWALSDLDQLHPDVGNAGWKQDIPAEMSHGTYRIAIFYDGHAGKLDKDNESL